MWRMRTSSRKWISRGEAGTCGSGVGNLRNSPALGPGAASWWQPVRLALGLASALGLARFAYGLLVPAMRSELHWSLAQAGALTTANGLGYLLGAVTAAAVARRVGTAAAFRLGMVLTAVTLAATAATSSYSLLLLTRGAAGVAGALVFVAGGTAASHAAARARSAVPLTIFFSGAGMGIAVSGALVPPLLSHHPERWPLVWAGLALIASLATAASWTAPRDNTEAGAVAAVTDLRGAARLWQPAVAYLLFGAGYIAYITFLSAYLASHHASVLQVALTWVLLGCAAVAAPALWSRPIATWPGTRALSVLLALLAGAAALALGWTTPVATTGSAIIYGAAFLGVPAAVTTFIRQTVPPVGWTATIAAFTVVFAVGQTVGPYLAGTLADHFGAGATLVWTTALCATGAAFAWLRTRGHRPARPAKTPRSALDAGRLAPGPETRGSPHGAGRTERT
jgi:predicted MFS family arabinose efflux permease